MNHQETPLDDDQNNAPAQDYEQRTIRMDAGAQPTAGTSLFINRTKDTCSCLDMELMKNVTMRRGRRRSRSINSTMESLQEQPVESHLMNHGIGIRRQVSAVEENQNQIFESQGRRRPVRKSKSVVSRSPYVDYTERLKATPGCDESVRHLASQITSIAWYLHAFGYPNCIRPELFCRKYDGLTGREYLEICQFVESLIGDEEPGQTDEEIIANLIEFALDTKYPIPITRTILMTPMAPAAKSRAICFLLWMCKRVYGIKYRGRGFYATRSAIETKERTTLKFYLQSRRNGKMNIDLLKKDYREKQINLKFKDFEDYEDLLKKRDAIKVALMKENEELESDKRKLQETIEESVAASERLVTLKRQILENQEMTNELKAVVERNQELVEKVTMLENEVKYLEDANAIQSKIQEMETRIKEQNAIQITFKLNSGAAEFECNILPALNFIFVKIGMDPLCPVLPKEASEILKQIKLIETSIEYANHVMKQPSSNIAHGEEFQNANEPSEFGHQQYCYDEETCMRERIELHDFEINELRMSLLRLEQEREAKETEETEDEDEEEGLYATPAHKKREGFYFE